ncbi:MAG: triose-phosphate isomerase [Candidatus Pacebacteria bacterium]|nr:triose-phosphate isomerase [Candidatus Paceibacterota bacterium]
MKKIIIANFKMNPLTKKEAKNLFKAYDIKTKHTVVLCPPFPFLEKGKNYILGAQNCFCRTEGPYTGAVSSKMLKDVGCKYILVGHSERRHIFGETDKIINHKVKLCIKNKVKPVLCIGENVGEKKSEVIKRQLKEGLKDVETKGIIIAYEPIFAIGTGKVCEIKEIIESYNLIKKIVPDAKVLYGGSVNSLNAKEILKVTDGILVGGASIKKEEFLKIIK